MYSYKIFVHSFQKPVQRQASNELADEFAQKLRLGSFIKFVSQTRHNNTYFSSFTSLDCGFEIQIKFTRMLRPTSESVKKDLINSV